MEEGRLVQKIIKSDVRNIRQIGRPQIGWMDNVERALDARRMSIEQERTIACYRNEWRTVMNV